MPRYIEGTASKACCPTNQTNCKDTTKFFWNLSQKLLDMAEAIDKKIYDLENRVCDGPTGTILFAKVDIPKQTVGIKREYIEYIKRYGSPDDGIFDPVKLELLRVEFGIIDNTI
jgi:hypothetical protein